MRPLGIVGVVLIVLGAIMGVIGLFTVCTTSNFYSSITGTPTCDETIAIAGIGFGALVLGIVFAVMGKDPAPTPPPTGPQTVMIYPGTMGPSPNPPQRFCQFCGAGNARWSQFCDRCGRPLPPPPSIPGVP